VIRKETEVLFSHCHTFVPLISSLSLCHLFVCSVYSMCDSRMES